MRKDEKLNKLAQCGINVAQFISVDKEDYTKAKYVNIRGRKTGELRELVEELIRQSFYKKVNIRSFGDEITKGNRFVMGKGIDDIDEILQIVKENAEEGRHSIINENIDVSDGGVSGVIMGNIIEFSPDDTPRCVEKEGVCSLPLDIGLKILKKIYGFEIDVPFNGDKRVEFSIHPLKQGLYSKHMIVWEYEDIPEDRKININTEIKFPNNFSRFLGDKVFGLLLADTLGIDVPQSTVISRRVAPFTFGKDTGSFERWLRTAPVNKEAGLFYTGKGWVDPFKLVESEEKLGEKEINIASLISQQSVESVYSGAGIVRNNKEDDIIEGTDGAGDKFMLGAEGGKELPKEIEEIVRSKFDELRGLVKILGEFTVEWVYDGVKVWVVQLNQIDGGSSRRNVIVEGGDGIEYIDFDVKDGLDKLRELIKTVNNKGIKLIGNVGVTSHFGDLLRLHKIPSYIEKGL